MTPAEKKQIWNALITCTRNGYPGATYQAYDTPKDPRVRGGRWYWTRAQLYDLYQQLVKWGEANEPVAAWRELEKYKTKIPPACLRSIYQSITFFTPPTPQTAGPNNPGNASDQGFGDESWINPTNVLVADNVYATVPANITPSFSNYLQTYNHGFSIPVAAVITGIEVQVKGKYTGTSSPSLSEINLWTGGLYPFGFNVGQKFPSTTFTTTNTVYTYGGPGDLWGYVGITPASINITNFGIVLQFTSNIGNDMNVDNINIKIYYTV